MGVTLMSMAYGGGECRWQIGAGHRFFFSAGAPYPVVWRVDDRALFDLRKLVVRKQKAPVLCLDTEAFLEDHSPHVLNASRPTLRFQ